MGYFKGIFLFVVTISITGGIKFRHDYRYYPEAGGWLKLNRVPANWHEAMLRCHLEGTVLASPLNHKLLDAMKVTMADYDVGYAFTGVHATFSRGDYLSVEGVPLSRIAVTWAPGQPDNYGNDERCMILTTNGTMADARCNDIYPYMCYKKKEKVMVMTVCGTTDTEYNFDVRTGHCYKFHKTAQFWSRAYMTCVAEGGYLAVINSDTEAKVISDVCAKYPVNNLPGYSRNEVVMLGFHDWGESGSFQTVHGKTLEDSGYDKWHNGEPNNATLCGGQPCGGAYRNGLLADLCCNVRYVFICEKSPDSLVYEEEEQ